MSIFSRKLGNVDIRPFLELTMHDGQKVNAVLSWIEYIPKWVNLSRHENFQTYDIFLFIASMNNKYLCEFSYETQEIPVGPKSA